ncbi:hypothetical protein AHAS_Ahas15G0117600 [Arachis hypogaea]
MLESLYLNDNQLIGEIPESIGSLPSLIVCNVSNNKLVGTVPDTPVFRKMDFSNFAGNNGLCRLRTYHCHPPVSSTHSAKASWIRDGSTREKIVSIVYGVVGFVSLIFIDLLEAIENFAESAVIGRGACGTVYKAIMNDGEVIAVKKLNSRGDGANIDRSFLAEISTLGKIRHRNIVKLHGLGKKKID